MCNAKNNTKSLMQEVSSKRACVDRRASLVTNLALKGAVKNFSAKNYDLGIDSRICDIDMDRE